MNSINTRSTSTLVLCVAMDFMGYLTYSLPFIGELADLFWAPISAAVFYKIFGGWRGAVGGFLNFLEEFLPGTDFIPSFTLMWLLQGKKEIGPRISQR